MRSCPGASLESCFKRPSPFSPWWLSSSDPSVLTCALLCQSVPSFFSVPPGVSWPSQSVFYMAQHVSVRCLPCMSFRLTLSYCLQVRLQMTGLGGGPLSGIHDGRGGHGSRIQELSGHMMPMARLWTLLCKVAWKGCCLRTAVCSWAVGPRLVWTLTQATTVPDIVVWGVLVPLAALASRWPAAGHTQKTPGLCVRNFSFRHPHLWAYLWWDILTP